MNNIASPPMKRVRLTGEELNRVSKDEIIELYAKQQDHLEQLRGKSADLEKGPGEKCKINENSRRESVLTMRLATKEQELQQYAAQIAQIKKSREDAAAKSLRGALMDPAVNLLFDKMRDELKETKDKLEQAQSELSAWKFTPDSQTGKKLMSRCRTLIAENQELGKQLSQGKVAQLEAELALQKKYSEDLKESQEELNEFVIQLDEEVEGMQSTIQLLQQQLNEARKELVKYRKMDLKPSARTNVEKGNSNANLERDLTTLECKSEKSFVKPEVGENGIIEHPDTLESLGKRNFENSELVCEDKGEMEGGKCINEGLDEIEAPMDVDRVIMSEGVDDGDTFSEHEIIDESQGSSPERDTPEDGAPGRDESPINGETYAIIDNGSDDEMEHVAQIVSTNDLLDGENIEEISYIGKAPRTPEGEFVDSSEGNENLNFDKLAKDEREIVEREAKVPTEEELTNEMESNVEKTPQDLDIRTAAETDMDDTKERYKVATDFETTTANSDTVIPDAGQVQDAADNICPVSPVELKPTLRFPEEQQHPPATIKQELQVPLANGPPQPMLPPIAHSLMQPTQVPMMGDPAAAAYLMNPHFQQQPHLPSAAHLAQQQALMAEQAAFMYKTMLAQQQQLAMANDKNAQLPEYAAGVLKSQEDLRTAVNPMMHGLPYMDQSTAFLAQYKAMLSAQPMFVPGPDGKTQMIAPGGLGIYPGLPLMQPSIMQQQSAEHVVAANSVPVSWPSTTNVAFNPHSLMGQGFLAPNPTGMMLYPGHSLTPQPVPAAASVPVETGKQHGPADHAVITNGLPAEKTQEPTDTNPPTEEPQVVA